MDLGIGLSIPLIVLGLIVMGIVAIGSLRDVDPLGARSHVLYLSGIGFITLFLILFSAFGLASSVLRLPFDSGSSSSGCSSFSSSVFCERALSASTSSGEINGGSTEDIHFESIGSSQRDSDISRAVTNLIVVVLASFVFSWARRRIRDVRETAEFGTTAGARTYLSFVYATCFVAVLTALGGAASSLIGLYRLIAPGVAAVPGGAHAPGFVQLVAGLILAAGASLIYSKAAERAETIRGQIASPNTTSGGSLTT